MKIFHLAPAAADFTVSDDSYETPVYDVYYNDFYRNYCTTKSGYGLDLQGDGTWTGMNRIDETTTESGFMDETDRFVDTSARVIVAAPVFTLTESAKLNGVSVTIDVYLSDIEDFPDDWALYQTVETNEEFSIPDAERYVRFVVNLSNPNGYGIDTDNPPFTFAVRVEVDKPVMTPLYQRTRLALDKLPEWMAMREIDNRPILDDMATPNTVGASVVNAVMGEWLDKISNDLSYLNLQTFIDSVDLNQVAWVHEWDLLGSSTEDIDIKWISRVVDSNTGKELAQAGDLEEFYEAAETDDIFFWEEEEQTLFTRRSAGPLHVYQGTNYKVVDVSDIHQVWNWLDDISVLVDLDRLRGESNEHFRKRILDVYINKPGASVESFKMALRRELDIWAAYGATPDSFYPGATPDVLEVSDLETDAAYVYPNGLPREKFRKLVEKLAKQYPSTWGHFYWGKGVWDSAGEDFSGYGILPSQFDATPSTDPVTGVGDLNDLLVYKPDAFTGPHQFSAALTVRGKHKTVLEDTYNEVNTTLEVYGTAKINEYDNPVETQWVTVSVLMENEQYYAVFLELDAKSNATMWNPAGSPEGYCIVELFSSSGDLAGYDWSSFDDGHSILDDYTQPHVNDVLQIGVRFGRIDFDMATPAWTDMPTYDALDLFFSNTELDVYGEPLEKLSYADGDDTLIASNPAVEGATPDSNWYIPVLYMRSRTTDIVEKDWRSQSQFIEAKLNGGPDKEEKDFVFNVPEFEWPRQDIMASPSQKTVHIKLVDQDESAGPIHGGYTTDAAGDPLFLPASYFALNGSSSWTDNEISFSVADQDNSLVLVAYDDFNRDDSDTAGYTQALDGVTETLYGSIPWGPALGTVGLTIKDNRLMPPEDGTQATSYIDVGTRRGYSGASLSDDHQMEAIFTANLGDSPDSSVGGALRANTTEDGTSYVWFALTDSGDVYLIHSMSETPIAATTITPPVGDFEVKLVVVGDIAAVYIDDVLILNAVYDESIFADSFFAITLAGDAYVDDVRVYAQTNAATATIQKTLSTVDGALYPLEAWSWELFEREKDGFIEGIVDENGPWRNDVAPHAPSRNFVWKVMDLTREDFDIPEDPDWVPTWMGIKTVYGANTVNTWLDTNIIKPVANDDGLAPTYPDNVIEEVYDEDLDRYGFGSVVMKARLRPEPDAHWYPQINSGFYFLGDEERYLYANRKDEIVTSDEQTLSEIPRQGAPIIVRTTDRQLLISDSFNRPDGADLGYTDGDGILDPLEWQNTDFEIVEGLLETGELTGAVTYVDSPDLPTDNYAIEYSTYQRAGSISGLLAFGGTSFTGMGAKFYGLGVSNSSEEATPDSSTTYTITLFKMDGSLALLNQMFVDEYPTRLGVSVSGNNITVNVNGHPAYTVTDNAKLSGNAVGFLSIYGEVAVDDFSMWSLDPNYEDVEYRQVNFCDPVTNEPTLENTEMLVGNGTNVLYLGFENVYGVTVTDLSTNEAVNASTFTTSNRILTTTDTDKTHAYKVTYKLRNSFMVSSTKENTGEHSATIYLDATPNSEDVLVATYEESIYNPATIIDLPLSAAYSRIGEGFIFISEAEYDFGKMYVYMSSDSIEMDPAAYRTIIVRTVDTYGNPKPAQRIEWTTEWGTIYPGISTTDAEGYGWAILLGDDEPIMEGATPQSLSFELSVTCNDSMLTIPVRIQPHIEKGNNIIAVPNAEQIPADGTGKVFIYGRYVDENYTPIVGAEIHWTKGRSLYEAFTSDVINTPVVTNDDGGFEIGPFTASDPSQPGFWFVVIHDADNEAGDVVFWHEYAGAAFGIDDLSGLPVSDIQMATPISAIPPYADNYRFPFSYDESVSLPATPNTTIWLPPKWYSLDWFLQAQLGILGYTSEPTELPPDYPERTHPPYRL